MLIKKATAEKLRAVADNMKEDIDHLRSGTRLVNTARRANMVASAEAEADRMEQTQKIHAKHCRCH
ncbi:hypothetical protein [Sporomusa aerivorans]|uniref:hypothetical protein n=1 Tax=Sporomusa aerivorans TaxID=204936 RepID=UPI00352A90A8